MPNGSGFEIGFDPLKISGWNALDFGCLLDRSSTPANKPVG